MFYKIVVKKWNFRRALFALRLFYSRFRTCYFFTALFIYYFIYKLKENANKESPILESLAIFFSQIRNLGTRATAAAILPRRFQPPIVPPSFG